jgi:hypothetical protein
VTWILPEGACLDLEGIPGPVHVLHGLGGGTQGQVFEVEVASERLALKWYLPACIARDPHLERRLGESIRATTPSDAFLWPLALVKPAPGTVPLLRSRDPGFGYLMELRPPGFVGAHEHVGGHLAISLLQVLRASFFLAEAFHALHLKGLCYKDISLGNLFLDPSSGRILICDNDNVDVDGRDLGAVLGTPGFMAPEILMGLARPGANSDLFSLAVLIFRLLTRHDPLRGRRELAIRCLDEPARRRLYGEDPLFIFDPVDPSNRPDPIEHAAALITWPIYPEPIKQLFEQTFGGPAGSPATGAHRPVDDGPGRGPRPASAVRPLRSGDVPCPQRSWPPVLELRLPIGHPAMELRTGPWPGDGRGGQRTVCPPFRPPSPGADIERPLAQVVAHHHPCHSAGTGATCRPDLAAQLQHGRRLEIPGQRCNLAPPRAAHTPKPGRSSWQS